MTEVMSIGEKLVVANDSVKTIAKVAEEITKIAMREKVNIISAVDAGNEQVLVSLKDGNENKATILGDAGKVASIIQSLAKAYEVDEKIFIKLIMFAVEQGEQNV